MLSGRSVLAAAIAIAVLSLVLAIVQVGADPDSDGRGADTYGTRGHGHRATFELLEELGVPVVRQTRPPPGDRDPGQHTLVLLAPRAALIAVEPAYLHRVAEWVRRGGRLLVAPSSADADAPELALAASPIVPRSVLEELGLPDVDLEPVVLDEDFGEFEEIWWQERLDEWDEELQEFRPPRVPQLVTGEVAARGAWSAWNGIDELTLPNHASRIAEGGPQPTGTLTLAGTDAADSVVAAAYPVGRGEVVVVANPVALANRAIADGDNAVLAVRLLAEGDRTVVFDEFYHGLTIRGNPLWLFTRPGYGPTTIAVLLLVGVAIWRAAVFLGPPLPVRPKTRRSISEYVDALSRLLTRMPRARPFLLKEVRDGVLHELRRELRLPPGREDPELLASHIARRDLDRAERVRHSVREADELLSRGTRLPDGEVVRTVERLTNCL